MSLLDGRLVRLRAFRRDDVDTLYPLDADPEFAALVHTRPYTPRSLAAFQAEFDRRQQAESDPSRAFFAVQRLDDESGQAVGDVGLPRIDDFHRTAYVGMALLPSARGQGLGRDALEVVSRFAFEARGVQRLQLHTWSVNTAMQRTAVACGFVEEGRLRSAAWYLGRRVDEVVYGLLADEWRARREARADRPR